MHAVALSRIGITHDSGGKAVALEHAMAWAKHGGRDCVRYPTQNTAINSSFKLNSISVSERFSNHQWSSRVSKRRQTRFGENKV